MIIAVDFDGTIVTHEYPAIGREIPFAVDTLRRLQKDGHRIILWSVRSGDLLDEAVAWCHERGLDFYAVNADFPGERCDAASNRKLTADMFIDDRNVGGLPDWGVIYAMVKGDTRPSYDDAYAVPRKKNFLIRLGEMLQR